MHDQETVDVAGPAVTVPVQPRRRPWVPVPPQRRPWVSVLLLVVFLGQMAFAMVTAARAQSATPDEPVYVGAAVVYLEQHSLRYNVEHPPLAKLIMDTGLVFGHVRLNPAYQGTEWSVGHHVLYTAGNDAQTLLFLARLPMIVLTLLFGLVVFAFARDLAGAAAGVVALALYAFSPDVIANGSLATLDVPTAGFLLTAVWLLWRARGRPALYLPLAGVATGAALATKMSALPAVPVLLLLAVLSYAYARPGPKHLLYGVAAAVGVGVVAIAVVWACYLVVDPHLRWTADATIPHIGGVRGLVTSWLPVPAPYADGMRIQFGFENRMFGSFLFGHQYQGSLWYYLPVALLVKEPLGAMVLGLVGAITLVAVRRLRPAALYLLVPAAVLLGAAMTGARDFGVRYAIVVPMFLAVVASAVVVLRPRWVSVGTAALVGFVAVSSLRAFPYYLPYSNEAFGGPATTYLRLNDSNSDWGQDLKRTADWLHRRYPGQRVWLNYHGGGLASYYGIDAADPLKVPADQVHGLIVISDTRLDSPDQQTRVLIGSSRRVAEIGYSMTIFQRD